jgi:hypothetical protein
MAYTLNRRLAELIDSNGQLVSGKIANGYISTDHFANNSITDAKLHTSFALPATAITGLDTDDLSEGSNLYYTDARVGTYISGNRTYGNITTTGYIAGPATFTIDPAAVGDNTGTVVIAGNLQVDGTTTTINSTTLEVDDLNITLAAGSANSGAANGAGLTVDCGSGSDATLIYNGTLDNWEFNKELRLTTGSFASHVNGNRYIKYRSGYDSTAVADFELKSDNNSAAVARITSTGTADVLQVFDNTTQVVTIADAGKVGIGTDSPTFGKLEVNGSKYVLTDSGQARGGVHVSPDSSATSGQYGGAISFSGGGSGSAAIASINDGGSDHDSVGLAFITHPAGTGSADAEEKMRITEVGNVGIGNTSPTSNLTIGSSQSDGLEFTYDSTNTYRNRISNYWNSSTDTRMDFEIGPTGGVAPPTVLSVGYGGNVGIGTTSPAALLHLKSTVDASGPSLIFENTNNAQTMNIDYYNNGGAVQSRIQYAEGPAAWYFQPNVSTGDSALTIHYNGTVDVGGNPGGSVRTHGVVVSDEHRNGSLGTTLGDTQRVFGMHNESQNQDYLTFRTRRITDGQSGWNHAVWDITRDIDNTSDLYRYMTFGTGAIIVNDFSQNMDFRVESNTNQHMLFVDGGTNRVGIGVIPETTLDVNGTIRLTPNSADRNYTADIAARYDSAHPFEITVENNGSSAEYFGVYADSGGANNRVAFMTGNVGIGTNDADHKLDVNGVIGIKGNAVIDSDGTSHYFKTPSGGAMYFYHGTSAIMYISSAGLLPGTDDARDLGSTSNRWRNLYTTDLHLSNEGKPEGNDVDGTTGNWTIQEGEEHLYIINNKSGKKYRFALEEIE